MGFIHSKDDFLYVDDNLFSVLTEINKIPCVATYGSSCAGHVEHLDHDLYYLDPSSYISFVLCSEKDHVLNFLQLMIDFVDNEEDSTISTYDFRRHIDLYSDTFNSIDELLEMTPLKQTLNGSFIYGILLRQYAGNGLDDVSKYGISLEKGTDEYKFLTDRYNTITKNWDNLAKTVSDFNLERGFLEVDYKKKDFLPFK